MSWKRKGHSKPVELIFKFDIPRKFTKVNIFTANLLHLNIQVFEKAIIQFSIGGEYYIQEPVTYIYMADTILKEPRNVSIRLDGQVGRYVKLELYFSNVWLSVSEVNFDSVPARGIYEPEKVPSQQITTTTSSSITTEITNQETKTRSTQESTKTQG